MKELKIATSWVRGVVGEAMTPELAVDFASAFGTWADGAAVVIGRDQRRSGPMLRAAVVSGLLSCGCEVLDLGVATTPLVSFAAREWGAAGGLSITGGHNDWRWNALKFLGPDGALLDSVKGEELLDLYHAKSFRRAAGDRWTAIENSGELLDRYTEHLLSCLDGEAIRDARLSVVADFANGAPDLPAKRFLAALGCRTPAPASDDGADLGFSLNTDGDRIVFRTGEGVWLSEEHTLPLAADCRLRRRPGWVVANLSTSRMVERVAARHGVGVIRTSVGESHVVSRGIELEASVAGEGSGGVAVLPITTTFDGLLALGLTLESMASRKIGLATLVEDLPRLASRKGEIRCPPAQAYRAVDAFRSRYAPPEANWEDGVRIDWPDAWLHVRASTTEPLLRLIVEAEDDNRADALFAEAGRIAAEGLAVAGVAHG